MTWIRRMGDGMKVEKAQRETVLLWLMEERKHDEEGTCGKVITGEWKCSREKKPASRASTIHLLGACQQ